MEPENNYFSASNNELLASDFGGNNAAFPHVADNSTTEAPTRDNNLRSVEEILPQYRSIFESYRCFNVIQSQVLDDVLYSDNPVVVSAPTGSGKTVIFELAIVRFLINLEYSGQPTSYKIVYVAPMKAICEERVVDWHRKFAGLGLTCISVTGDSDNIDLQSLHNHNLIITTPEKWDSLTRRWRDNKKLAALVKLFMIDEVHLLGEDQRGPTLEAIVSRMKTIQDLLVPDNNAMPFLRSIRFVAVSATIPNVEDIAQWLSTSTAPAKSFKFDDDMRPVKLKKVVLGYRYSPATSTSFKFDIMLSYKLQNILMQYAEGKPTLIFCNTRKSVEMTAQHLTQNLTFNLNLQQKQTLQAATISISDNKIQRMLSTGVCYHHAGLASEDRKIVEELFRNANLPILVTTSTLAMGVNLPAHLVIVKSTKHYHNGQYQDYSETMLQQMIGRAGRPQFDVSATAVILTTEADKQKYENMVSGGQPIESSLHKHLIEHLNAEVVLRTITDLGIAVQWLNSTFLHIRAKKHPRYYGLPLGLTADQIDKKLLDMCQIEINKLARAEMLTIDEQDIIISPTNAGSLMAKYCIAFETMKLFIQVSGKEILQQMLSLISKCQEFSEIYLRVNDKKTLNLLNKCRDRETIRFPFNDKIKTVDMKINCVIQAVFGSLQILQQSLVTESQKIMRIGERTSNCLAEYLETKGNCYLALLNALILVKCFHTRLWENSPFVTKQLPGIGSALSSALVAAGKVSFKDLLLTNPREIERIINRKSPMGNTILDQIKHLPDYELTMEEAVVEEGKFAVILKVFLKNASSLLNNSTVNVNSTINLLVGDTGNNVLLYEKHMHSYFIRSPEIVKTFELPTTYDLQINAHLISEDWVGFDCNVSLIPESAGQSMENKTKASTASDLKTGNSKKPSHIQTFMDTYFKNSKPKNQRRKQQENVLRETPNKSDGNKENIYLISNNQNWLENNNKESTIDISAGEQIQPNDLPQQTEYYADIANTMRFSNMTTQDNLQKIIGNTIDEYKKYEESKLKPYAIGASDYCLSSETQTSNINPNNASIISSNNHSAVARRNLEPNNGGNPQARSSVIHNNSTFESAFKLSQQTPSKEKKQFRLKKNLKCTVDIFENSIYNSDPNTDEEMNPNDSIFLKFKYTPHKRLDTEVTKSNQPNKRGSTEANMTRNIPGSNFQEFPGSCGINKGEVLKVQESTPKKSNENSQKTLTWRSPLVTSPEIKYSPKEVRNTVSWVGRMPSIQDSSKLSVKFGTGINDSAETSARSSTSETSTTTAVRPTLRQNMFLNTPNISLTDRDSSQRSVKNIETNLSNYKRNLSVNNDVISTSLLQTLGLLQESNQSQTPSTPNAKPLSSQINTRNVDGPSVTEYYSQLMVRSKEKVKSERQKLKVAPPKLQSNHESGGKKDVSTQHQSSQTEQSNGAALFSWTQQQPESNRNVSLNPEDFSISLIESDLDGSSGQGNNQFPVTTANANFFNPSFKEPGLNIFGCQNKQFPDLTNTLDQHERVNYSNSQIVEASPRSVPHCGFDGSIPRDYSNKFLRTKSGSIQNTPSFMPIQTQPTANSFGHGNQGQFFSQQDFQKPSFDYLLPSTSQVKDCQSHCCCTRQPLFQQPQPLYRGISQGCIPKNSNFDYAPFANIQRQTLQPRREVIPLTSRKRSFQDSERNIHDPYSLHRYHQPSFIEEPVPQYVSQSFVDYGQQYCGYNQGDKQFLLQRYLGSVEQKQMKRDTGNVFQNFTHQPSHMNLFGKAPDDIMEEDYSNSSN